MAVARAAGGGRQLWGAPVRAALSALLPALRVQAAPSLCPPLGAAATPAGAPPATSAAVLVAMAGSEVQLEVQEAAGLGSVRRQQEVEASAAEAQDPGSPRPSFSSARPEQSPGEEARAELEEKLRRTGGPVSGGASRERQLRQACVRLLKDIVVPERGKAD